MKKLMILMPASMIVLMVSLPAAEANAQVAVLEVIKAGVKKVIKAVDLKIQRMQNETIWLQNAQKVMENQLSKLKLTEISDWTERQRLLYAKYYTDLWKVKAAISYYQRIREITIKQVYLVEEYRRAWHLAKSDKNFSPRELEYIYNVYTGILNESVKNMDQILLIVNSFKTQMSDAKRLELINQAANRIDQNYTDLIQFNNQNLLLSMQRARAQKQIKSVQSMYQLQEAN
ncbi:conjugal transfer protein TraI [Paradesertivirga mongoliensis]|uniref:Conjugal transfer protein TraI n=1 Tax=Paradesertivirga mongoliensis TaxID=2100740 RepID=A0ABW4ZS89_9SPHI|nr:conjugal transfer protein TraI [Pedobacter mongoliensis]